MSNPTENDLHTNRALTDISIAYTQDNSKYIANRVFGHTPVMHKTDSYRSFDKNDWLRNEVRKKSAGQNTPIAGLNVGSDTFKCETRWIGAEVLEEDVANQDEVFDIQATKTRFVTHQMLQDKENDFASNFMTTGKWATDSTPATLWDDPASDPRQDVITGSQAVEKVTGYQPNTLVVTREINDALRQHPLIIDQHKYTSSASITEEMIANYFGVDRYFVMSAIKATNVEGGTEAYDYIEDANALLCFVDQNLTRESVTAAQNFVWRGLTGLNDLGSRMDSFPVPDRMAEVVRAISSYDMKVVANDLGYLFNGAITS